MICAQCNIIQPKLIRFGNIDYAAINKLIVNCLHLMCCWKERSNQSN